MNENQRQTLIHLIAKHSTAESVSITNTLIVAFDGEYKKDWAVYEINEEGEIV